MNNTRLIAEFSNYTRTRFGYEPRRNQLRAAETLAVRRKNVNMGTGSGKTLVAALAALMCANAGETVYIVTVNDYLSQRDYSQYSALFDLLGVTSALNTREGGKNEIHAASIIYTSVQELLFDYTANEFRIERDHIPFRLDTAILDEIDYVLLDDANTRFSVSLGGGCYKAPGAASEAAWIFTGTLIGVESYLHTCRGRKFRLEQSKIANYDFAYNSYKKQVALTERGLLRTEEFFKVTPADTERYPDVISLCHTALSARYCYLEGVDYLLDADGYLCVMNRSNGRAARGTQFDTELDYFLRMKENVRFAAGAGTYSNSMSAPSLFRKFKSVCGMSGTAARAREELCVVCGAGTAGIPSGRVRRRDFNVHLPSQSSKASYISEFVRANGSDYAYLIVTSHEREAAMLGGLLDCPYTLLTNAQAADEQSILDLAGDAGHVLLTTRMTGRGTDIITAAPKGLAVFLTQLGMDIRTDIQVRGRAARNGCPGVSVTLTSREDDAFAMLDGARSRRKALAMRRRSQGELELRRTWLLAEDIILENLKIELLEWLDTWECLSKRTLLKRLRDFRVPFSAIKRLKTCGSLKELYPALLRREFTCFWLDFRRSVSGRVLIAGGLSAENLSGSCRRLAKEARVVQYDAVHSTVYLCCIAKIER